MRFPIALLLAAGLAACDSAAPPAASPPAAAPAATAAAPAAAELTPAQRAYAAANDRMHAAMGAIPADPDAAFVAGMIPHHQGAIDMARIVLEHGKDPANKALATRIIAAQEAEIAEMQRWQQTHGGAAPAAAPVDHSAMGH